MRTLVHILLFLVAVFAAWALWLGEVLYIKGWPGLAWLQGFNWSSLPICALIALLATCSLTPRVATPRRAVFFASAWLLAMLSFLLVRTACFDLFSGGFPTGVQVGGISLLLLGWLVLPIGLAMLTNRWITPLYRWAAPLVAAALLLAIPLAVVTIRIFPAVNGNTDQIHAFKMGYPVLWITALVPLALLLSQRRLPGSKL